MAKMHEGLDRISIEAAENGFTVSKSYESKDKNGLPAYREPVKMVFNDPMDVLMAVGECLGVKATRKQLSAKLPIWERNAMKEAAEEKAERKMEK